jgi:sterol desaturase/sphingolipid hydroxylase (fatty acid hydroxylase superfamily)
MAEFVELARTYGLSVAGVLLAMALLSGMEAVLPLRAAGRFNRAHLWPNLALTFVTFATNFVFNTALLLALIWQQGRGLLGLSALSPLWAGVAAVLALDFAFYLSHVAMHKIPGFWRFHRVHHSDPAVDVTTTIRQHPVEGVIRYAFLAFAAIGLGVSPAAFAVYRLWSTLSGLTEHANLGLPVWFDSFLSWFVTSPNMHKVHHSRDAGFTDTNYGNMTSLWDRLFGTFIPARFGIDIAYGLTDCDAEQTTAALLALPWRREVRDATLSGLHSET